MTCGVCGSKCRVERHDFFEGVALHSPCCMTGRHARDWTIMAPLYFKPTADGLGCEVPFCGAKCATEYARHALWP